MSSHDLATDAELLHQVAREASEESDAVERHPEVIEVLVRLAAQEGLGDILGTNGHDPNAYAGALAEALGPYRDQPFDDNPELVFELASFAGMLSAAVSDRVAA